MTTMTEPTTTQVYRVYIRTTPEAVWDAITKPEWTERYGYQGVVRLRPARRRARPTCEPGAAMREFEGVPGRDHRRRVPRGRPAAPARPDLADADGRRDGREGFTRLTYEIEPIGDGVDQAHGHPRARERAEAARTCSRAGSRPRAPAAAGRGCSATSRPCSRAGRTWPRADDRDDRRDVERLVGVEARHLRRSVRGAVRAAAGGRAGRAGRGGAAGTGSSSGTTSPTARRCARSPTRG